MEAETKKRLLYGAGALASIVGLVYIMKKAGASSQMPINAPSGGSTSPGSSSNSALEAARLQAATQLTVAQMNADIASKNIAAQMENASLSAKTQQNIAASAALAKVGSTAAAPGGAATTAVKSLFDVIKELVTGKPSPVEYDSMGNPMTLGASGYLNGSQSGYTSNFDAMIYLMSLGAYGTLPGENSELDSMGNPMTLGASGYLDEGSGFSTNDNAISDYPGTTSYGDYFQGSIGSGDTSWFGSSSTEDPVYYGGWYPENPPPIM